MVDAIANAAQTAAPPLAWDPATHLLSRLTFGPTPAAQARLAQLGPDAWFAEQVSLGRSLLGYKGDPNVYKQSALCRLSPYDLIQKLTGMGSMFGWDAMDQLSEVTAGLQVYSTAQFY